MQPAVTIGQQIPISSENVKTFQYFIIALVTYFIVKKWLNDLRKKAAYGNAATDPHAAQAIQIRQGCNPTGITIAIEWDGTWDDDLMLVADQITDLEKVDKAYSNLYNENMFQRLEKELTSPKFQEWLRRAKSAPTVTPVPSYSTPVDLAAVRDTVVLRDTDSTKVAKRVKAGETIGTRIKAYSISDRTGKKQLYYLVTWTSYLFLTNQGLVLASDTQQI